MFQIIGVKGLRSGLAGVAILGIWVLTLAYISTTQHHVICDGPSDRFLEFMVDDGDTTPPQNVLRGMDSEPPAPYVTESTCIRLPKHDPDRDTIRVPCMRKDSERIIPLR